MFDTNSESVLSVLVKIECEQMQGRAGDCDCEGKKASFSTQVAPHPISPSFHVCKKMILKDLLIR